MKNKGFRTPLLLAGALVAMVLIGVPAQGQTKSKVEITVIQAKAGPPFLHNELKPLWDTLQRTFGDKFSHYQKITSKVGVVEEGQAVTVSLPDGTEFEAMFSGLTPKRGLMRIHLAFGEFRTKVRIHDGGVFFQAGRKYKGGTLIIAVSASLTE